MEDKKAHLTALSLISDNKLMLRLASFILIFEAISVVSTGKNLSNIFLETTDKLSPSFIINTLWLILACFLFRAVLLNWGHELTFRILVRLNRKLVDIDCTEVDFSYRSMRLAPKVGEIE